MHFCLIFILLFGLASALASRSVGEFRGYSRRASSNVTLAEVVQDLETATTCGDCQSLVKLYQEVANDGDEAFIKLAIDLCETLDEGTTDFCEGFMTLEGPMLAFTLRNMIIPSRTSDLYCNVMYGLCDIPPIRNFTVSFPKAKPNKTRPAVSGKTPIEIVHISDIHVDLSYEVGASYNCTESICCRTFTPADAPNVTAFPAGPFGNNNCDSPLLLEESLYAAIEHASPNASFTMFTGDIVEGAEWLTTHTGIVSDINSAYTHMAGLNLVYPAVGNHEASPVNSYPLPGLQTPSNQSNQYMYNTLASNWVEWIGGEAAASASSQAGSYSVLHPNSNLRIISINTMFWMKENFWLFTPDMPIDPASQFAWLVTELQGAEDAGERVYIIGHIPPGRPDALYDYSSYFDQIVQRYDATIAALFWGHTHQDQFEISYSDYSNQTAATATMIHFIAPALTPTGGYPTFRIYTVDPETYAILDYTVYFANMSLPSYQIQPTWTKLYSIKEAYGSLLTPPYTSPTAELTPSFWHNLTELFENDDAVFQDYYVRKQRGYEPELCTGSCKTDEICQLRSSQSQFACYDPNEALSVKKRDDGGKGYDGRGECPGSRAVEVFRNINDVKGVRLVVEDIFGEEFLKRRTSSF